MREGDPPDDLDRLDRAAADPRQDVARERGGGDEDDRDGEGVDQECGDPQESRLGRIVHAPETLYREVRKTDAGVIMNARSYRLYLPALLALLTYGCVMGRAARRDDHAQLAG